MFWLPGSTMALSGATSVRHHSVLKIAACSGAVTAALWSWQAISAADNQAKVEGRNIRLEFDQRMYSRVTARFDGKETIVGPFSASETLTADGAAVSDFTMNKE